MPVTVTNLNDAGAGSLRDALGAITRFDTINFQAGLIGTIALGSQLPDINFAMIVDATGAKVTISGQTVHAIINVQSGGDTCQFKNLTFKDGSAATGGAINCPNASNAILQLVDCTFRGNAAVYAGGALYVDSSCSATITSCTFYANTCTRDGGAICNNGSSMSIINSTLSGNSSGGGYTGRAFVNGNVGGPVTIKNSIFWGDTGGGNEIDNQGSTVTVTYSCVQGGIAGTGNISTNPLLGAIADNGGYTYTMLPAGGSPVIGTGVHAGAPTTDQIGSARPNPPSMGALEQPPTPAAPSAPSGRTVTTTTVALNAPNPLSTNSDTYVYEVAPSPGGVDGAFVDQLAGIVAGGAANNAVTGLVAGHYYADRFRGHNGIGDTEGAVGHFWTIPANPASLTATPTTAHVSLAWSADLGATGYNVKRRLTGAGSYVTVAGGANVAGTAFDDASAVVGTVYDYLVTALDASGESAGSNVVTTQLLPVAPAVPDLSGAAVTATGISGHYPGALSAGSTSYGVKIGLHGGARTEVAGQRGVAGAAWAAAGKAAGTEYDVEYFGINDAGTTGGG